MFKGLEMGKREYGEHTFHRAFRMVNYFWVQIFHVLGGMRPIGSRFLSNANGPLNYSGIYVYVLVTMMVFARCRF